MSRTISGERRLQSLTMAYSAGPTPSHSRLGVLQPAGGRLSEVLLPSGHPQVHTTHPSSPSPEEVLLRQRASQLGNCPRQNGQMHHFFPQPCHTVLDDPSRASALRCRLLDGVSCNDSAITRPLSTRLFRPSHSQILGTGLVWHFEPPSVVKHPAHVGYAWRDAAGETREGGTSPSSTTGLGPFRCPSWS